MVPSSKHKADTPLILFSFSLSFNKSSPKYSIKNENNIEGDIEIISTGLRPGEKLFEELLINSEAEKTFHPLIYRANEECVAKDYLIEKLNLLERKLILENKKEVLNILLDLVPEWKASKINNPNGEI